MKKRNSIVGQPVIVRSNVAGVHAGIVEAVDFATQTVTLINARRLWRVYTRDKSGSVSDIAANGLMEEQPNQIGAKLSKVIIVNPAGLELAEMTQKAYQSVLSWVQK